MASDGKHTLTFSKDPQKDRRSMIDDMKGFKGAKYPANPYKDSKPNTATDEFYTPHKGGEKK